MKQPNNYEKWGIASAIPGLQIAIDLLQDQLDRMRAVINGLETAAVESTLPGEPKKRWPKPGTTGYWSKMTPEERKKEMARRYQVSKGKAPSKAKQAWRRKQAGKSGSMGSFERKVSEGQKKAWANYTPAERQARIDAAVAGRKRAAKRAVAA